jgi:hypothetical protein
MSFIFCSGLDVSVIKPNTGDDEQKAKTTLLFVRHHPYLLFVCHLFFVLV